MALKTYHVHRTQKVLKDPFWMYNCTAYGLEMMLKDASLGAINITGQRIRAMSSEPQPDPASPGLNISQMVAVAAQFKVTYVNKRGHPWSELVASLDQGKRVQAAVDYGELGSYRCQGGDFGHSVVLVKVKAGDRTKIVASDPLCSTVKEYPSRLILHAMEAWSNAHNIGLDWAVTRAIPRIEA